MVKAKKLGLAGLLIGAVGNLAGGCAHYSESEKFWAGAFLAGQVGDFATTKMVLDEGGREANPIYGDNPSNDKMLLIKAGGIGIFYLLGEIYPEHREEFYKIGTFIGVGLSAWNYNEYRGLRGRE